ncbi:efflux RND transporter periplasmic adaptor subunit [Candidatus Desulfatibia sp.]|uniref:efflux RND transporter periplasmic adaptor subunit n=1 Tax=Candidatus Desulfatibia sp. TaxID=3101189 RepID=UPI0039B980B3
MTKTKNRILHFSIAAILILSGVVGLKTLIASKPDLQKKRPPVPTPLARVITVKTAPHPVTITGQGTVRPIREIRLVSQVSGKIVHVSSALVNGGAFNKGDLLLRIDPADYQIAVTLARARVKDSESKHRLAIEESAVARQEWMQLRAGSDPPPLVAKEPQLAAAQAKLDADHAELKKAQLQLARTHLTAPFDGRVSDKSADIGQYVTPGQMLAVLYDTAAAEIVVPMEDRKLFWFQVPGFTPQATDGSEAEVQAQVAGRELSWPGQVVRVQGKLDEHTRMINVVVRVEQPYAVKPPLAAGLFATVKIKGRVIENAAVIPRSALRPDGTVWVVDANGRLEFRRVVVALFSTRGVVIESGLASGEKVVISSIKAVTSGMKVRRVSADGGGGS